MQGQELDTYLLLTSFPLDVEPIQYIATQVDGRSNIIHYYEDNTPEQAAYFMFLSSGFGISQKFIDIRNDMFQEALNLFINEVNNDNSIHKFYNKTRPLITIPVNFDGKTKILYYYDNDSIVDTVYNFFNSLIGLNETSLYKYENLAALQLEYRVKKIKSQIDSFKDVKYVFDDTLSTSNDICYSSNDNKNIIRDSSQILIDHLASLDVFNTFVINMRQSVGRREHMKNQLLRSKLRPAFLMPGIDPTTLPQVIQQDVLHKDGLIMVESHAATFIAHYQVWNQIIDSELPFAIIFEDDVEINPNIKCLLRRTFQELPANWSVIYLNYADDLFWPDHSKSRKTNIQCTLSVTESQQPFVQLKDLCAAGNARSYVLSYQGAVTLAKKGLPIFRNIDVYLRDMIYENEINAFVINPAAASFQISNSNVPTDMINNKYIKIDVETNSTVYTYRPGEGFNCSSVSCTITLTKDPNGNYIFS